MAKIIISTLAIVLIFSLMIAASDTKTKNIQPTNTQQDKSQPTDFKQPTIPQLINYQGKLTDNAGNPQNGNFDMTFKIFDALTGGTEYWNETQTGVMVTNGLFNVILGSVTQITNFPSGPNCYLEITINTQTITPRQRIVSNGYSYYAAEADDAANLGGVPALSYVVRPVQTTDIADNAVNSAKIADGQVQTGDIADGNITMPKINQAGATTGQVIKWTGSAWAPGNDSIGGPSGPYLPLAGGTMTGPITNTGNPAITMGQGNFGTGNLNPGTQAFVAGFNNRARGDYSVVSGGGGSMTADSNSAIGSFSAISGGTHNTASGNYATVGGGGNNSARAFAATVGGGASDTASSNYATVGGGFGNTASNFFTTVSGGERNTASNYCATVGGGRYNKARGLYSVVSGGGGINAADSNSAIGNYSTISGGNSNCVNGLYATVGGGYFNAASGDYSMVGGGGRNTANSWEATVGGGAYNTADRCATVGGGYMNAAGWYATVGGGWYNTASGLYATVAGGDSNTAGSFATVSGGYCNLASGNYATVNGGYADTAAGAYSLAAGQQVRITSAANNTFAFGNNFTTSTPNAVIFSHPGAATRVGVNLTNPQYAIDLPNNANVSGQGRANAWTTYSSKRWKENIRPISQPLNKIMKLQGIYFDWKESKKKDIGLIAEEVGEVIPEVVSYEENGKDAKSLDYSRLVVLLIEGMKEQQKEIDALKKEIEQLKIENKTAKE